MNQFSDVFLALTSGLYSRAATSQKCIRAGGKHNDLTTFGTPRATTPFFEMLGNWSASGTTSSAMPDHAGSC